MDTESQLNIARTLLNDLGNALADLVNASPDIFEDSVLKSRLADFQQAYQEARQRLAHPSLCIATIGTTSSGKSTIVNALMGRRIAPIANTEMSAGVLTLKHSQARKLIIEKTPDADWETGEWTDLGDEDFYKRIQVVMNSYHQARKKREYVAPQIKAYLPLFPACDRSISGLPEGIEIEFLDLPGLKSVQDRTNLAIIQQQVGKAFSLVALDYMQVDEEHRQKLLGELKKVVEYLQGRTDSMIFILNRVDQRGADDLPIETQLETLKEEIKQVLNLPELPDVIPFNARLLYYAQCAWGTTALDQPSTVNQETRLEHLNKMLNDCLQFINLRIKENNEIIDEQTTPQFVNDVLESVKAKNLWNNLKPLLSNFQKDYDLKAWFNEAKERIESNKPIDDKTMRTIVQYALKWSGGDALWECIRARIQDSFAELVILPILLPVFKTFEVLSTQIDSTVEIKKLNNKEEVEQKIKELKNVEVSLQNKVDLIRKDLKKDIKNIIDNLKSSKADLTSRVTQELQGKKREGFQELIDTVNEVKKDLNLKLISPVQDALKNNQEVFLLEDILKEIITPAQANDIARAYDRVTKRLGSFTASSGYLTKKVKKDDKDEVKKLEDAERAVRGLYSAMKKALKSRAEFILQTQAAKCKKALVMLIEDPKAELIQLLYHELPSLKLDSAIIADFEKETFNSLPKLPDNFIDIPEQIKIEDKQDKVLDEQKSTGKTEGSCFNKKPVYENIYKDVEYKELSLPNSDKMAEQWLEGIQKGEENVWNNLCNWIIEYLDWIHQKFDESVNSVIRQADYHLEKQLKVIDENFEEEMRHLQNLEKQKSYVTKACQKLKDEVLTQREFKE